MNDTLSFMGWFSNLFKLSSEKESAASAVTPNQANETKVLLSTALPYSHIRNQFINGDVAKQIEALRKVIFELPAKNNGTNVYAKTKKLGRDPAPWGNRYYANKYLIALRQALHPDIFDGQRAEVKELIKIIHFVNETLPAKVRDMEVGILKGSWEKENSIIQDISLSTAEVLEIIAKLPTKRSSLTLEEPTEQIADKRFPNLDEYKSDETLYNALKSLEDDWVLACSLSLSSEDEYVIERVGNAYLPDALLLFDRFQRRGNDSAHSKAKDILKEQVELIHHQVKFVIEQNDEDNLNEMETHTAFLRMKNNGSQISEGLKIDKSSDKEAKSK